ncbi:MAG: hypothetical protein SWH78_11790 [Thermodesulfobacteriota bacterium]|nr:hypothetical protein [Thermodesulfobacteriota bacterium]
MLKKLIFLAAIISIMPVAQLVLAQPFGFFGMRSALKNNYLEDVGASFLRMNVSMQYIFSADFSNPDYDPYEDVWDYKAVYDDLTTQAYGRGAQMVVTLRSPTNMERIRANYFRDFIVRTVERYDGDSNYGCTQAYPDCYKPGDEMHPTWDESGLPAPAVKFWQIANEVDRARGYWVENPQDYAELVNLFYSLIKETCPECKVLLGSLLLEDINPPLTFYDDFFQQCDHFDILDFHHLDFDRMGEDHLELASEKFAFLRNRYPSRPIWMTETSTYTGSPLLPDGSAELPYQDERTQALELFKRYIHLPSLGVERILWNFLSERKAEDGVDYNVFWNTGLVYDGEGQDDMGLGVKKLSYFTYKLLVEKLGDADWHNITATTNGENVSQYLFTKDGAPVYVLWYHGFTDTEVPKQVTLDVSCIRTGLVTITEAIPSFDSGEEANTVPFEEAFEAYTLPITNGAVVIALGREPVFIEECRQCVCDLNYDGICDEEDLIIFSHSHGWGDSDCDEPGVECPCDLVKDENGTCDDLDGNVFLEAYSRPECRLGVYIEKLKPKPCVPGDKIRIIGNAFGSGISGEGTPAETKSIVHVGGKQFEYGHPKIKLWTENKIKVKIPKDKYTKNSCAWFNGEDFRKVKVWVTVGGLNSNKEILKVMRPVTCP